MKSLSYAGPSSDADRDGLHDPAGWVPLLRARRRACGGRPTVVTTECPQLLTFVNNMNMLTNVHILRMWKLATIGAVPMQKSVTPATFGALVRDARTAAGISQSELGERIGASRFWVAQFEKGKPSAELGLALKAVQALGLAVRVEAHGTSAATAQRRTRKTRSAGASPLPPVDLGEIIAALTVAPGTRSNTEWPSVVAGRRTRKRS